MNKNIVSEPVAPKLVLNMAGCKKCGTVMVSTHVHDFRSCRCGAVHVDGGLEYLKRGGNLYDIVELSIHLEGDGYFAFVVEPAGIFGDPDVVRWFKHHDEAWHSVNLDRPQGTSEPLLAHCGAVMYPSCRGGQTNKRLYSPGAVCAECAKRLPPLCQPEG